MKVKNENNQLRAMPCLFPIFQCFCCLARNIDVRIVQVLNLFIAGLSSYKLVLILKSIHRILWEIVTIYTCISLIKCWLWKGQSEEVEEEQSKTNILYKTESKICWNFLWAHCGALHLGIPENKW